MIRVMMADDNRDTVRLMNAYLSEKPDVRVVACAPNGYEALRVLRQCVPDVLLLDLHMPVVDGFGTLLHLQSNPALRDMRTIVMSGVVSDALVQQTARLGAAYCMFKPVEPRTLYERILLVGGRDDRAREVALESGRTSRTGELLRAQGIRAGCRGYAYLNWAMEFFRDQGPMGLLVTKRVYPQVARGFGVSVTSVERAIRGAIQSAWARGGMAQGGLFTSKPSNGEFLSRVMRVLQEEE